jgi:phage portal protein BeeE
MADLLVYGGNGYAAAPRQTLTGSDERIEGNFAGLVHAAYKNNGVIFACILVRQLLFSEARFQFQRIRAGRPGDLFGTPALDPLETPWRGGTTGDLLTRMEQDGSIAGNAFIRRNGSRLERLRPDWVTIVVGSRNANAQVWDLDTEVIGYVYQPGGPSGGREPIALLAETVAHYAPIPDPVSPFRGMSWLQAVITETEADSAATEHKRAFFANGATVNQAIVLDPTVTKEMFEYFKDKFNEEHQGVTNAYKTVFLGGGADLKVLGSTMQQMEFKQTQGAGETRIAAAAGVPPVIVGLSEGLQAATYSNYGQARRRFADGTMRPLWRQACGALATIIDVPADARLWYDARDIAFLQEDEKDEADIQAVQAQAIASLVTAGYTADSVVAAVVGGDLTLLEHSGLFSVQLNPAGSTPAPADEAARAIAKLVAPHLADKGNGSA